MPWWSWVVTVLLLIFGVVGLVMAYRRGRSYCMSNVQLAHGAVCIALSSLLSMIRIFHMPLGGSVTVAAYLPILMFSYVYGMAPGALLGTIFGFFRFLMGGGNALAYGIVPFLLDYPVGYALLGVCGLFGKMKNGHIGLTLGIVAGCVCKTAASVVSGAVFFSGAMPEGFVSPWIFALAYNGSYMIPECAICVIVALIVGDRLLKRLGTQELRNRC